MPIRNRNSQSASFLTPLHFYIQSPFRPLLHEILSVLHQCVPSHQISLYQCFFFYVVVGTSHDSFNLIAFAALPYLTVNARATPPAFPCEYLIAVSANYLGCKWIAFRPVGIGVCPMMLQECDEQEAAEILPAIEYLLALIHKRGLLPFLNLTLVIFQLLHK